MLTPECRAVFVPGLSPGLLVKRWNGASLVLRCLGCRNVDCPLVAVRLALWDLSEVWRKHCGLDMPREIGLQNGEGLIGLTGMNPDPMLTSREKPSKTI